jgi:uncharacterized protein (TIGR04255 family)
MTLISGTLERRTTSTSPRPQYARAPILEAILEIRAVLPGGVTVDSLRDVRAGSDVEQYTEAADLGNVDIRVDATGGAPVVSATNEPQGYQFRDPSAARLFQARLDGFSFHKHAPYTHWEEWRDEARRLWNRYREVAQPVRLSRIGIRYINRLDLPPAKELKDYLLTAPDIAPGLPQNLTAYAMQLSIPWPDLPNAVLVVRQAMVEPPSLDVVSILLDLDVVQVLDLPANGDDVWVALEELHTRENDAFEWCITNRTRALFS